MTPQPEDFYGGNTEWYGALVAPILPAMHAAVARLLGPVSGDVVEVGAGIGACVPVLARAGAARIFAVEPSPWMRVGLMSTIAGDPELLQRTTIIAAGVPEALGDLPARWGGAVMLHAIGHLDDPVRAHWWTTLHERLEPGAPFVVSLQQPETPMLIPWTDFGAVQVGTRSLRTRGHAEPISEHHVAWTMEWSLLDEKGAVLERRSAVSRWRTQSATALADEAASFGFRVAGSEPELGALAFRSR